MKHYFNKGKDRNSPRPPMKDTGTWKARESSNLNNNNMQKISKQKGKTKVYELLLHLN